MSGESDSAENKYEIREVIGKGAFGEVNLVVEKQTKQRYVLKRIKMARQSEWQRRATRQEIEIVSRLRHPFIMPYKEHWIHHGHTINVVYGYCEKGDLTTAITKQRGKLFPEDTLRLWLAQLLLAADCMHKQNVLHRDIKTQNVLLTGDGDVQIGDFGLSTVRVPSSDAAKQQESAGDDASTVYSRMDSNQSLLFDTADGAVLHGGFLDTPGAGGMPDPSVRGGYLGHPGMHVQQQQVLNPAGQEAYTNGLANAAHVNGVHAGEKDNERNQVHGMTPVHDAKAGTRNDYALVGTPHFMSPELLSSQKYSYETDIWSLGVVMYELTTLKPPFNAFNLAGLVAKIKRAALPPIPANYSADWSAILKSMLRKDPAKRASSLELLAMPSMRPALQQAYQRALAIMPDFTMPDIPFAPTSDGGDGTPGGFCFDVAAAAGAGAQHTPSAGAGVVTPVLIQPNAVGVTAALTTYEDEIVTGSTLESESSPLSKFPDLAAASSPLPTARGVASANGTRVSAPGLAAAAAAAGDARRSKTPAVTRRPAAAAAPGTTAAGTKCMVSPRRAAPQPAAAAAAGAGRSKTPGRPLVGAAIAAKADADAGVGGLPSSRLTRRPRDAPVSARATVAASPRDRDGSSSANSAVEAAATGAQNRAPLMSPARHRGGAVSGSTPRVATNGNVRSINSKRGLLDNAPPMVVPSVAVMTPRELASEASDVTTQDAASTPTSSCGGGRDRSSPAAAPASARFKEVPSARALRSASVNTARTTRTALATAAGATTSPTSGASRRGDMAAAAPASGATRRGVTATDGGAHLRTAPAAAPGTRRIVAAVASSSAAAAAQEGAAPGQSGVAAAPMRTAAAAAAAITGRSASVSRVRRTQTGTATAAPGGTAAVSREAPEDGTPGARQRVRSLSYATYGTKPAEAPASARRATGAGTSSAAGLAAATAARGGSAAAATVKENNGAILSHALSASDAATDSYQNSASGSSPETASNAAAVAAAATAPESQRGASTPDASSGRRAPALDEEGSSPYSRDEGVATAAAALAASSPHGGQPLVSVATEESELSLPDGRYTASELSHGGLCEQDSLVITGSATPSLSPHAGVAASDDNGAVPARPSQWNSNQLYSGSYGSFNTTVSDSGAPPIAGTAVGAGVPPPDLEGPDSLTPTPSGTVANLSEDLPRRVSASTFTQQLLSAGAAADSDMAVTATEGDAAGGGSESSTAASSPMAPVPGAVAKPLARRLVVHDSGRVGTAGAGAGPGILSPRGFEMASASSASPSYGSAASTPLSAAPSSASRPTPSPSPSKGPAQAAAAAARRHAAAEGPAKQNRARTGTTAGAASPAAAAVSQRRPASAVASGRSPGTPTGASARVAVSRASPGASPSSDAGSLSSPASTPRRARTIPHGVAAVAAASSALEVGSPLGPVAEVDSGEEAESSPPTSAATRAAGTSKGPPNCTAGDAATTSARTSALLDQLRSSTQALSASSAASGGGLGDAEREQLALLQRVVSLASSLWEAGRDAELGMVLSSTLSRPLERRATKEAAHAGAAISSLGGSGEAAEGVAEWQQPVQPAEAALAQVPSQDAEPGDTVRVTAGEMRGVEAVVRYRGPCHWGAGVILGLELPPAPSASLDAAATPFAACQIEEAAGADEPGTRDGVTYFRCQQSQSRAAFVLPDQVVKLSS